MESNIKELLQLLKNLQEIDSDLDEIEKLRGALPEEAKDLEDEVAGLLTRQQKIEEDITILEKEVSTNKNSTKDAENQIKTYEEQQLNVRNNREYDAITKEIEYQKLEIQHLERKNKKSYLGIEEINAIQLETSEKLETQQKILKEKNSELETLISESKLQEEALRKKRKKAAEVINESRLKSYEKIRGSVRNGLAVVSVRRGACGGCFNIVPPQKQAEIREQKKILVCEYCGRIICDVLREEPPKEEKKKRTTRRKASPKSTTTKSAKVNTK